MKHLRKATGVNSGRKLPSIADGFLLLQQLPQIRDAIRYRSNRYELCGSSGDWRVYPRSRAVGLLTNWKYFGLVRRNAESILRALQREGEGLKSDDENPVLLTNPEFKADVRLRHMPNVRRFFRYRGRTFYELQGTKWVSVSSVIIYWRISDRIVKECGYWIWMKSQEACIEELKLEGRNK